jgi:hypothetical protein
MGIINVRSIAFKSSTKFLLGSRFIFGSMYFVANELGDLRTQELVQQEILGSGTDRFPPTMARIGLASKA